MTAGLGEVPFREGTGLACVKMLLAAVVACDPSEQELLARLDRSVIGSASADEVGQVPSVHAALLDSYGLSVAVRKDARVADISRALDQGHRVVAFLGAKALRKRVLPGFGPIKIFSVARAGYAPVVVTGVEGRRVCYHDPDPRRGGEHLTLRKGRHTMWRAGNTFEQIWGVWQGWIPPLAYLTLRMPPLNPRRRLAPWVFVEAWRPDEGTPAR